MAKTVLTDLQFSGGAKATGLPAPTADSDAVPKVYVDGLLEGLAWKDNVRVATQANLSLASPGATIDGVTMVVGDRVLVKAQTTASENGIYVWNGAAVAMGRSSDAQASADFNNAVVSVDEGTDASTAWRCSTLNPVIGTDSIAFGSFGGSVPAASESTSGTAKIATQAQVDAGTDDATIVTPLKLATWAGRVKKVAADVGDGSSNQIDITHNLGTRDITVAVYRKTSPYDEVLCDIGHLDTNTVRLTFATAPTAAQFRAVVVG